MLKDRSFDHMLGFLYTDEGNVSPAGDPYEGLTGTESNPDASGPIDPGRYVEEGPRRNRCWKISLPCADEPRGCSGAGRAGPCGLAVRGPPLVAGRSRSWPPWPPPFPPPRRPVRSPGTGLSGPPR